MFSTADWHYYAKNITFFYLILLDIF